MHPRKQAILNIIGQEPTTLDELFEAVKKVIGPKLDKDGEPIKLVGLQWDIHFDNEVSNSHSCPLNGVTNWSARDDNKPTHYRGWSGRVWVRFADEISGWGSDIVEPSLIYVGTGGFGGYMGPWEHLSSAIFRDGMFKRPVCYSWDCKIWLDDWPELEKWIMFEQLGDKTTYQKHFKLWEDAETKLNDDKILKTIREKNDSKN